MCGYLHCLRLFLLSLLWINFFNVTTQMKATEQYFPVMLFIVLYKVVLSFESVDEILKCHHSSAVLSCGTVYCHLQGCSNF